MNRSDMNCMSRRRSLLSGQSPDLYLPTPASTIRPPPGGPADVQLHLRSAGFLGMPALCEQGTKQPCHLNLHEASGSDGSTRWVNLQQLASCLNIVGRSCNPLLEPKAQPPNTPPLDLHVLTLVGRGTHVRGTHGCKTRGRGKGNVICQSLKEGGHF
jgi:hypothetical protein